MYKKQTAFVLLNIQYNVKAKKVNEKVFQKFSYSLEDKNVCHCSTKLYDYHTLPVVTVTM